MGEAEGVSKSTVQRWFSLFGVKPHLSKTFKLSNDPFFIEKVRDITGLYLNPPDHATWLREVPPSETFEPGVCRRLHPCATAPPHCLPING